jgi:hypothetical protein
VLFEKVVETLQNEQREVSRVVTPQVQNCMTPAYEGATNESGAGSYERMKVFLPCFIIFLFTFIHFFYFRHS